ncbi:MAG: hypothetical protein WBO46_15030 [Caldilineaceae bacterium]
MSSLLRTMKRRPQIEQRKKRRANAFAAYREAMQQKGDSPAPKREWRQKWAEE